MIYLLIFVGGGTGAVLRYLVSGLFSAPYGTLAVNIIGSLLLGALLALSVKLKFAEISPNLLPLLAIGLLGGFTTFSTFSMDVVNLLNGGQAQKAVIYMLASLVFSVGAAYIGYTLAK